MIANSTLLIPCVHTGLSMKLENEREITGNNVCNYFVIKILLVV